MVTFKRTLVAAAMAAGVFVSTAAPAHAAYFSACGAFQNLPDAHVCVDNQQYVLTVFVAPQVQTPAVPLANVAAYIYVYTLPNSPIGIPCVVATVNATGSDECASLGLVRTAQPPIPLINNQQVNAATPFIPPTPLLQVDICTGDLNANYHGIGINNQPIITPCLGSYMFS
jgi:hypothetical protein